MTQMMTTREVSAFLKINEKMVYSLITEKGLPASKITGKWLFPKHLVEQWVEINTLNFPKPEKDPTLFGDLLVIAGSNDLLLDKAIYLFNRIQSDHMAVFANLGSMGGLRALRRNRCHIAASHLLQEDENEYNFEYAYKELEKLPAIVNFSKREQGILVQKGNPKNIESVSDLANSGVRIVNRAIGAGTRLLLDNELKKAGIPGSRIKGYGYEVQSHLNLGLEILSGRADAGPGIRAVAGLLDIDFIPLRWERYDLMIFKEVFFEESVQRFLGTIHDEGFRALASEMSGYDLSVSGKMIFKQETSDSVMN